MPEGSDNLLLALNKWAPNQQENYLTEAFAYILRRLQRIDPDALFVVLCRLTSGAIKFKDEIPSLQITTQVPTAAGTPDIEIAGPDLLVYIEVKDQSPVDDVQLLGYSEELGRQTQATRGLVLLTRRAPSPLPDIRLLSPPVRWPAVYRWLGEVGTQTNDEVTQYMVDEFRGLLGGLGMAVEKVGWSSSLV